MANADTTTAPLLGRCKECDYALFATNDDVKSDQGVGFAAVKAGAGAFRVGNNGIFARCTNGHKVFMLRRIKGTYSPDHKCDARCLNAKGHNCTCSCGGANHGRGHAVKVTAASEISEHGYVKVDVLRTAGNHLGEVGKYICGTATVTRVTPIRNGVTLYTFVTAKGDTIKWFVPAEHNPHFEQGAEVTFRARVKAHEDHERFGKATVVVYLEETA
jgi:hypothetical protein